ncbi:hypothetical protein JTE90_015499 [Oedothorax gibbosus]|uniref:Uncharacterized protein n=1 Tax=Oedothorax gibbosus TaxID=931172 RepID=A0AAV6VPN5_9ARAC|nr:hypothetical protein JTE90_015499 [Oedothorax gibbosus]
MVIEYRSQETLSRQLIITQGLAKYKSRTTSLPAGLEKLQSGLDSVALQPRPGGQRPAVTISAHEIVDDGTR